MISKLKLGAVTIWRGGGVQLTGVTFPPIVEITSLECTSRAFPVITSSESQLSFVTVLQEPVEKCMTKEGIISSKEQLFSKKKLTIFLFEKVGGGSPGLNGSVLTK